MASSCASTFHVKTVPLPEIDCSRFGMNLARNLGELVQELSRRSGVSVTRRSIQRWRRDPRYKAIARKTFDLDLGRGCEDLTRDCGIGANEGRSYGFDSHTRCGFSKLHAAQTRRLVVVLLLRMLYISTALVAVPLFRQSCYPSSCSPLARSQPRNFASKRRSESIISATVR